MTSATHSDATPDTFHALTFGVGLIFLRINTHSDPDESPSTVPALMLMATPFS